jgi:hypothetical protein
MGEVDQAPFLELICVQVGTVSTPPQRYYLPVSPVPGPVRRVFPSTYAARGTYTTGETARHAIDALNMDRLTQ